MDYSHKVADKGYIFTKISQMASTSAIFTTTDHTKQLNPWPNSSTSHVVNYSQLSACQEYMQPFEGDLSTRGHLTGLKNKPQQSSLFNFQHQYLPELLDNVYSYCLMMKSVPCCCVHESQLFSNPVTNVKRWLNQFCISLYQANSRPKSVGKSHKDTARVPI